MDDQKHVFAMQGFFYHFEVENSGAACIRVNMILVKSKFSGRTVITINHSKFIVECQSQKFVCKKNVECTINHMGVKVI